MAVTDRRYRKTEETITSSMISLLSKQPMEEVTVGDLVRLADINRSTFYLHYQSLDAVLGALEDRCITLLSPLTAIGEIGGAKEISAYLIKLLNENSDLFSAVTRSSNFRFEKKLSDLFFPALGVVVPPKNKKTSDDGSLRGGSLISSVLNLLAFYFDGNARLEINTLSNDIKELLSSSFYKGLIKD